MIFAFLGMPGGPELILILVVVLLLFGGSKLPQLAKALGQSKRAFKDGLDEAEQEAVLDRSVKAAPARDSLQGMSDEELFEEARRRAEVRRVEK